MKFKKLAITTAILVFGAGSGLLLGKVMVKDKPDIQLKTISSEEKPIETAQPTAERDLQVSVTVDRSEKAISDYLYEEAYVGAPEIDVPVEFQQSKARIAEEIIPQVSDGLKAEKSLKLWEKEALKYDMSKNEGFALISIIIDDVGVTQEWSKKAISLPAPMTMSVIPYGRNLSQHIENAQKNGHEIMLHLPMEPGNPTVNPGENALKTDMDMITLVDNLLWNLGQFDGYVGINNHMGSKFTEWEEGMRIVLSEIKRRELVFIDSVTTAKTVGYKMALEMGIPTAVRDLFLDHDMSETAVKKQLEKTEKRALKNGHAIAIGHPHKNTINVLNEWAKTLEARGFKLVPASVIIKKLNQPVSIATNTTN